MVWYRQNDESTTVEMFSPNLKIILSSALRPPNPPSHFIGGGTQSSSPSQVVSVVMEVFTSVLVLRCYHCYCSPVAIASS